MIVFDIDGTLSILGDRLKYLNQEKKDWDSFYKACREDKPNKPIIQIYKSLRHSNEIRIITGRRESERRITQDWLQEHGVHFYGHELLMRPDGDYRPDYILKEEITKPFIDQITMVFEDRQQVVDMWRRHGITCLQVANGGF